MIHLAASDAVHADVVPIKPGGPRRSSLGIPSSIILTDDMYTWWMMITRRRKQLYEAPVIAFMMLSLVLQVTALQCVCAVLVRAFEAHQIRSLLA